MIELVTLNAQELDNYIHSDVFKTLSHLPISTIRAQSQMANPRLHAEDVLLILAKEGERLAGYLGMIPDLINLPDHASLKCGWMSCIWVDSRDRGKGISRKLIVKALEVYDDQVLATEFTPQARKLYEYLGFFDTLQVKSGIRLYRRLNMANILPAQNPKYAQYKVALLFADRMGNAVLNVFFWRKQYRSSLKAVEETYPDPARFEEWSIQDDLFNAEAERVQWILDHPWISDSEYALQEKDQYYFSVYSNNFYQACLKISNGNVVVGFVHYVDRDGHLKIPYVVYDMGSEEKMAETIYGIMVARQCHTLTIYHPRLSSILTDKKYRVIHKRPVEREYLGTRSLVKQLGKSKNRYIHDGDGDCGFT